MTLPEDSSDWSDEQWKEAFEALLGVTIESEDKVADAIAGGWALGRRRSRLLGHTLMFPPVDVTHGLTIFCFIWLKPPPLPDNYKYLTQKRWQLFDGVRDVSDPESRFEVVPDWLLKLDIHQLHGILQTVPIRDIIRIGP